MSRSNFQVVSSCLLVLSSLCVSAQADEHGRRSGRSRFVPFKASGTGVFGPLNAGTNIQYGNAGVVIGDGSGITPYRPDETTGTSNLGDITHNGSIQTFGTGFLQEDGTIVWPGKQGPNSNGRRLHVMTIGEEKIYLTFYGRFTLDNAVGTLRGDAIFRVRGGTGRFRGARGFIYCLAIADLTQQEIREEGAFAPFDWDWRGFLRLRR